METDEAACVSRLITGVQNLTGQIESAESQQKGTDDAQNQDNDIMDLNGARAALNICLQQLLRVQRFLNDDSCWWKMLKERDPKCCGQKMPHLHGLLDGERVTLKLVESPKTQLCPKVQQPPAIDTQPTEDHVIPEKIRKIEETDEQQISTEFESPIVKDALTASDGSCTSLDCHRKRMKSMKQAEEPTTLKATCATMEPSDDQTDCGYDDECNMKCITERTKLGILPPKSDVPNSGVKSRSEKEDSFESDGSMNLSDDAL